MTDVIQGPAAMERRERRLMVVENVKTVTLKTVKTVTLAYFTIKTLGTAPLVKCACVT
jgi:hypothetical protein